MMMEREIVTDLHEFIRRTKPLFESVERFSGLRAKARYVLFSKRTSQKALFDQLQRLSHNGDKQPYDDLDLGRRHLFLYWVFRSLIRGNDNKLPERIDLVRRISQKQKQAPLTTGQLLQLLLRERDTSDLQHRVSLYPGSEPAVCGFR